MKILMSGSGSGGHIYPCIATYNYFKKNHQVYIVIFKKIDEKIYKLNNIKYIYIDDSFSTLKKIKMIKKIIITNNIKKTMTFGGKNSIFINIVAKSLKIDNYIFEQNAILGKANKINYLICKKMFSNFKIGLKKEINIGNPNSFNLKINSKEKLFNNNKATILITMGSLGSSSVDKVITNFINENNDYNIIYILGNNVKGKRFEQKNVKVFQYYNHLVDLIAKVDLCITRAGASTLSEIIALKKPSIIIPSPYVANNHQEKNAKILAMNNACIVIKEKDLSVGILKQNVINLTHNAIMYNQMANNLKKLIKDKDFINLEKEIINDNIS